MNESDAAIRWASATRLNITVLYNTSVTASLPLAVNMLASAVRHTLGSANNEYVNDVAAPAMGRGGGSVFQERSAPILPNAVTAAFKFIGPTFIAMALALSVGAFGVSLIDERETGLKKVSQ